MTDNKITDYKSVSKSNHKILKIITIILSILILICIFFLIIGFINKFDKLKRTEKIDNEQINQEYSLFYPKEGQIISVDYNRDNKILLRYQLDGENKLILIDLIKKKIMTKINFKKSKDWKIE
tara:strand:- start:373 stop:741 length:369 start_codon:yes stop_codon:yes gene_type:complete